MFWGECEVTIVANRRMNEPLHGDGVDAVFTIPPGVAMERGQFGVRRPDGVVVVGIGIGCRY
jgi:hypothetical protein